MKNKKAGFLGILWKFFIFFIVLFGFLVVAIKYPNEWKIIVSKLYNLTIVLLDLFIELIGWIIKGLTGA